MYDVLIVGGGAVGLFTACRLIQLGFRVLILEEKTTRSQHSRSIGIHPPSLEYLEQMDLVDSFLDQGLKIPKGLAVGDHRVLGELDFRNCSGPYRFVLTLPQFRTEGILERYLTRVHPQSLQKGKKVTALQAADDHIQITAQHKNGHQETFRAQLVVGCDGRHSTIRKLMNIPFRGGSYPDTFIMGDFADTTGFGAVAVIYLQSAGLIESFPLPENKRRWVVRTPEYVANPSVDQFKSLIELRTGFTLPGETNTMLSSFGVQHYRARYYGAGRTVIIGDAAHIVNPFGGQGMNLGWMDAWDLSRILEQHRSTGFGDISWKSYNRRHNFAAWQAIRRSEFNMRMGRAHAHPWLHEAFIKTLMHLPTRRILPRLFTMRGL